MTAGARGDGDLVDVVLRGGDVVDVATGRLRASTDVAVKGTRIAAVGQGLAVRARREFDVRGTIVTPGLVDLHTHVFTGGTYYGIDPDAVAWRSGVTTWVDAGSAGAHTFGAFHESVRSRTVAVHPLLNVSAIGLVGENHENYFVENVDVDRAVRCVAEAAGKIVGIKARIDRNTTGPDGIEPLRRALLVAGETGLPVMAHIGAGPPAARDVLDLLRPGDVVTHCANGVSEDLVDTDRRVGGAVLDAYGRGVLFDVGHGVGGFSFEVMEAMVDAGCPPHTVSSDLHAVSIRRAAFDLPTVMTKLVALGLPLVDIVVAATKAPVDALLRGTGAGTLSPGATADIAVFDAREGPYEISDAYGTMRNAPYRLVNRHTFVAGDELLGPTGLLRDTAVPSDADLAEPGSYPRSASAARR